MGHWHTRQTNNIIIIHIISIQWCCGGCVSCLSHFSYIYTSYIIQYTFCVIIIIEFCLSFSFVWSYWPSSMKEEDKGQVYWLIIIMNAYKFHMFFIVRVSSQLHQIVCCVCSIFFANILILGDKFHKIPIHLDDKKNLLSVLSWVLNDANEEEKKHRCHAYENSEFDPLLT